MSFSIKPKFKSVFSRTTTPSLSPSCHSVNFCDNFIHEPLFECCCSKKTCSKEVPRKQPVPTSAKKKPSKKSKKSINTDTSKGDPQSTNRSNSSNNMFLNLNDLSIRSKKISHRQMGYEKDCSIIQSHRLNSFRALCDKFENTCITPRFMKLYKKVPEHDKKILNRMAIKRIKDSVMAEDTIVANKYWRQEKEARDRMVNQQSTVYSNTLKTRREREQKETELRLAYLNSRDQQYRDQLKQEIQDKYLRVNVRVENLKLARDLQVCDRRALDLKKQDNIGLNGYENRLNEELRRQDCLDRLEEKIREAEKMKVRLINAYRNRLMMDNEISRHKHAANIQEVKKVETNKFNQLIDDLSHRDQKLNKFVERKNRILDKSKIQAKTSAELRDFIRNSCTSDALSFRLNNQRTVYEQKRPPSDLSFFSFSLSKQL